MKVYGVAGNVVNLEKALDAVTELTGLKPFIRFDLVTEEDLIPVVLLECGDYSLELLGNARGIRPSNLGYIEKVVLEVPDKGPIEQEVEPGLTIAVKPGEKARLTEIHLKSSSIIPDLTIIQSWYGVKDIESSKTERGMDLKLGEVLLRFSPLPDTNQAITPESLLKIDPLQRLPGWHRFQIACPQLEQSVDALIQAGAQMLVPPYKVFTGFREALLILPSGLIIQPVEQKLWKMLPIMAVKMLGAKLRRRPMRFKV